MERQDFYEACRIKYPDFIYKSYLWTENDDSIIINFNYEIVNLSEFNHKIEIKKENINFDTTNKDNISNLVFNLGLVELVSYWKTTCSPNIVIDCGYVDDEQEKWFKKLYFYGLGELFYRNGIKNNIKDFVNIKSNGKKIDVVSSSKELENYLIPIGGGKDSCVTLEKLKSDNNYAMIVNPTRVTLDCAKVAEIRNIIKIRRTIDKKVLELNDKGYINGHTPFSAMIAFLSTLIAYMTNKKYIALSNESSANEANVDGTDVNHQYSKSIEFENDFRWYSNKYLITNTSYFSFLRPITEYQIGYMFSKLNKYHKIFRSCNVGSKNAEWKWCNKCSKCLFVFTILSPFLYKNDLIDIFGVNLFQDKELLSTFIDLIGYGKNKPFDCVGTYEEVRFAISKTIENLQDKELPFLLKYYKDNYKLIDTNNDLLKYFNSKHNLNIEQLELLKEGLN